MKKRKKIREKDRLREKKSKGSFSKGFFGKFKSKNEKYLSDGKVYKGKMSVHAKGFGFCVLDDLEMEDVFIAPSNINGAFNGDEVEIVIYKTSKLKSREGKVVRILNRAVRLVVGNFVALNDGSGYVEPDMKNVNKDIYISSEHAMNAKNGEKVVAKLIDYGSETSEPKGEIVEIIGDMSRKGDDIIAIIRNYELYEEFPIEVNEATKKIPQEVSEQDIKGRKDLRNVLMCTIDGEDARDFDDAVSISRTKDGGYELGVHIADVGHYVKQGSVIDKEAYNRGTSVYFPDMVLPMLPRELSNGICSLNPEVDRLALSVIATLDKNGDVIKHEICESVINSNERMTYTDVYAILQGNEGVKKKYANLVESFLIMDELDTILEQKRKSRGALDFDLPETYVKVDEQGKTIDIAMRERNKAHRIIESFMILANEIVAKEYNELAIPFVYRVHEKPTLEKMNDFFTFISSFGINAKNVDLSNVKPKDLQFVIEESKQTPYNKTINEVMLRSLQKAKYFQKCLGHFGLASKFYCHFTSPIRRYPDLTIHRIIKAHLHNELNEQKLYELEEFVLDASERSSEREKLAEKAEREVVAYKKCEYMQKFIGEEFQGYVSGVSANGVFVALPNTVEGFISIANLPDDVYNVDEKMFCLQGSHFRFVIGQEIKVRLINVNLADRHIDFEFVA